MTPMILAAAEATAGPAAIITAIGGACVSVFTVYRNAKRQDKATQENTDLINNLNGQIAGLTGQVIELRAANAALSTELSYLKGQFEHAEAEKPAKAAKPAKAPKAEKDPKKKKK